MRVVADVVIVGGGVIGCSAAYQLSHKRGMRVIVIEKGPIASGMTKRSSALIHTLYPTPVEARLAARSLQFFQNWALSIGGHCGYTKTGALFVAGHDMSSDSAGRYAEQLMQAGSQARSVDPRQVQGIAPGAYVEDVGVAVFDPEAGFADAALTTQAFVSRAKEKGTVFQTGTFAKAVLTERGRVNGVDTNAGSIETLNVVIAAGPWSDRLLSPLGTQIGIRPALTRVAFFNRPPSLKTGHVAFLDSISGTFMRPHSYGLTLAGLQAPAPDTENPDDLDESIPNEFVTGLHRRIAHRLPELASALFVRGHSGIYDMTADGHAIIDRVPGVHGLFVAAGFGGTGFALAPAVGECIMEMVSEGSASTVDVTPLRFERQANFPKQKEDTIIC